MIVKKSKREFNKKVCGALREGGIDPNKANDIPLFGQMLKKVSSGKQSINWLVINCRKILAINKKARKKCAIRKMI